MPGKLKKSRAIRIKWCGIESYALARSSQITCSSVLSLLAESIEFHIICESSRHRGRQVSRPSGQMYLYNDCSSERLSYGEQELQKIFPPLHLGGILGKNLWYLLIAFPLVSKYHQPDTIPVIQYPSSKPAEGGLSFLRTRGQFLYNLYYIPFMPGALPARALLTKSRTSFSFIPLSSNITVGS